MVLMNVNTFSVADTDLLELNGIFGNLLSQALDIIERDRVTIYRRASDQREYFEIAEDHNITFKLLPYMNYCLCTEFQEKVITTSEQYTCKHVLAARLAGIINKVKIEKVSDDTFTFCLQMIKPTTLESHNE